MAASLKSLPTGEDVEAFIAAVPDAGRREDAQTLCRLLAGWTGAPPAMWGASIVYLVGGVEERYPIHRANAVALSHRRRRHLKIPVPRRPQSSRSIARAAREASPLGDEPLRYADLAQAPPSGSAAPGR